MKIAIVSSNEQIAPPPSNVVIASLSVSSDIAEELAKRKHEIYSVVGRGSSLKTHQIFSKPNPSSVP